MKSKRLYLEDIDDMESILKKHELNFLKGEKKKIPKMKKESQNKYKKLKLAEKS